MPFVEIFCVDFSGRSETVPALSEGISTLPIPLLRSTIDIQPGDLSSQSLTSSHNVSHRNFSEDLPHPALSPFRDYKLPRRVLGVARRRLINADFGASWPIRLLLFFSVALIARSSLH